MNWENEEILENRDFIRIFIKVMKILWEFLENKKKLALFLIFLSFFDILIDIAWPFVSKLIVDNLFLISDRTFIIAGLTGILFVLEISRAGLSNLFNCNYTRLIIPLEKNWLETAHKKLMLLSLGFHQRENTGKKISKIQKGCSRLLDLVDNFYHEILPRLGMVIFQILFLLCLDWKLALPFLFIVLPAGYFNLLFFSKIIKDWDNYDELEEKASGLFCQSILNIKAVKESVQEFFETTKYSKIRSKIAVLDMEVSLKIWNGFFRYYLIMEIGLFISVALGLYLSHLKLTSVGNVVFVMLVGDQIISGIKGLSWTYNRLRRRMMSVLRIAELMKAEEDIKNSPNAKTIVSSKGELFLKSVYFQYQKGEKMILSDINLEIRPGKMVALVGRSGEGKTTLIRLLNRLFDPTSGEVLLDDQDIKSLDLYSFRKLFAIVPQEVELWDTSIKENISYGFSEISDEDIITVLKKASFFEVLENHKRFPNGLETEVGERGVMLSGGERQRVGIARAFLALKQGAKFLILDEATSNLDSQAESVVQNMLSHIREHYKLGIIIIAHRLATVKKADLILVLNNGHITEMGTHRELLSKEGVYAGLVKLQDLSSEN